MKTLRTLASLALLSFPAAAQGVLTAHAQILVPDDPSVSQFLGRSMDVSGTTLVTATGGLDPVAIVFERTGGAWQQVAILEPPNSPPTGNWGNAIAVDGHRIAVGGYANNHASAWVYERIGGVWTLQGTADLPISNQAWGAPFVDLSGDLLAIGNYHDPIAGIFELQAGSWTLLKTFTGPATFAHTLALDGGTLAISIANSGLVRIYEDTGAGWTKVAALTTGGTKDIAIDGDRLLAGNYFPPSKIYHRVGGTWTFQQDLVASDGDADDEFGRAAAIDGDFLVLGANQFDGGSGEGKAYLYAWDGAAWNEVATLLPPQNPVLYGLQVGLVGTEVFASEAYGGRVHAHAFGPALGTSYCVAGTNSVGTEARIVAFGSGVATDDEFHLGLELAVPNQFAIPLIGPGTSQTPLGDGFLCVTPPTRLSVLKLDAAGAGHYRVRMGEEPALSQITNLVPITMNFQTWYRDAGSSNLTDAVTVDFL